MNGLVSPSTDLADTIMLSAIEQLRNGWCRLQLDNSIFLSGRSLEVSLADLRPNQRRELLVTILALCEEPERCLALQAALEQGRMDPAADPAVLRSVNTLRPVLVMKPPKLHVFEKGLRTRHHTETAQCSAHHDISLLGLRLRMENTLRRNGCHQLRDLIGLDEQQLRGLRGVGNNGLQELRDGLARLQLPFPLTAAAAATYAPLARSWTEPLQARVVDQQQDQQWMERAQALIGGASTERPGAHRILDELISLTLEHFSGLSGRCQELRQLRNVFIQIEAVAQTDTMQPMVAEGLQALLLQAYHQQFHSGMGAQVWLQDLQRAVAAKGAVEWFLRFCAGETLQSIVDQLSSPISREAVRKRIQRLAECAGQTPRELATRLANRREQQERQKQRAALEPWLQALGRLPFQTDCGDAITAVSPDSATVGQAVMALNLHHRLELYAALGLAVPEAEWALHLRLIANGEHKAGVGYWHREEALTEFLHRYAEVLGAPGLMPKQLQLPSAVKGAVQRFGGQGVVAAKVGLTYQGQLVGENGRAYWTEERLRELLEQAAAHAGLAADGMPNRAQLTAFLVSGVVPAYRDKQPNTVFAALSRQGRLRWREVADRFGRVWPLQMASAERVPPVVRTCSHKEPTASTTLVAVHPRA
jgi:Bacterial RNA polymerase, alpha chain C terminal domain